MALECKGSCHAARRVSSSHECIIGFDRQRRCRTGDGVSFLGWGRRGGLFLDKGRRKADSASGVRKDDVG